MLFRNFLSPIDDYSNLPFRLLCQRYGADATCVPLVNSTAIARDHSKLSMVDAHPDERNIGVQLVGNDPATLARSCEVISSRMDFVSWFNVNCGCPSVRTMNTGGGSALLSRPDLMCESVAAMKAVTDKPISVKIRIKKDLNETLGICNGLAGAGADFIIIHGRTAAQGYSGRSDWGLIRELKHALSVPLVGNGDLLSMEQANRFVAEGYCDSFMVARAAMGHPDFFQGSKCATLEEKTAFLTDYLSLYEKYVGEPQLRDAKLKAVNFINGIPDASWMRNRICKAESVDDILEICDRKES